MSTRPIWTVHCDGRGADCLGWVSQEHDAPTARAEARYFGWKRRRVDGRWLDLCPACASPEATTPEAP